MRRILLFTAAVVAAISLPVVDAPDAQAGESVGWVVSCPFSHRRSDDPIVFPRQAGASHSHDFFGNRSTRASSTYRSLLRSGTTCRLRADRAAYWIPTVSYRGRPVEPVDAIFYYRSLMRPWKRVHPYPRDLRIIAGNPRATEPQRLGVVWWECGDGRHLARPPADCVEEEIVLHIRFPECWDGKRVDSATHKRHMAYAIDLDDSPYSKCPKSHPVAVPRLIFRFKWQIRHGTDLSLSSGSIYSMHGDFINSWRQRRLRRLVDRCINAGIDCGRPGES